MVHTQWEDSLDSFAVVPCNHYMPYFPPLSDLLISRPSFSLLFCLDNMPDSGFWKQSAILSTWQFLWFVPCIFLLSEWMNAWTVLIQEPLIWNLRWMNQLWVCGDDYNRVPNYKELEI